MDSIQKSNLIVKIRASLYQMPNGELVGFGPVEARGGYGWCYNCNEPGCDHVKAVSEAWLGGQSVEAETIPASWYSVTTADFTARIDRETGKVSYVD